MGKSAAMVGLGLFMVAGSFSPALAQDSHPDRDPMEMMESMMGGMGPMGGGCPMMRAMGMAMMHGAMMQGGMMDGDMMRGGMMGGGMMGRGMGMEPGMARQVRLAAMVAGRLAYLKGALDITDAQEAAWKAYADAVTARVKAMQDARRALIAAMQQGSAVDRIDARIKGMETMLEAMKAVKPAIAQLYAALTDDQKETADELIGIDCGAM